MLYKSEDLSLNPVTQIKKRNNKTKQPKIPNAGYASVVLALPWGTGQGWEEGIGETQKPTSPKDV